MYIKNREKLVSVAIFSPNTVSGSQYSQAFETWKSKIPLHFEL